MSAHLREHWEAAGLKSSQALTLVNHIRDKANLGHPEAWVKAVEARAIAEFVGHYTATSIKASGESCRELLIVACARFGVNPSWFFTNDDGEVEETSTRELRAEVAYYRILHGLDEELCTQIRAEAVPQVTEFPETVTVNVDDLRTVLQAADYINDRSLLGPVDRMGDAVALVSLRAALKASE